jgi:phosphoserine phosphatase RsbU/P
MLLSAFANVQASASIADQQAHSVIGAPKLASDGQASGTKPLPAREGKQILKDDRDVRADVIGEMAVSLRNGSSHETQLEYERLARDLKSAEQVQHQLLPQSLPKLPGYAFFAYYRAAHEVGGDYYDFVPLPNNRLGIALGDVSGKGVAAALIMAKFSGDARLNLRTEGSTAAAARVLNTALCETGIDDRFITLSLLVLEASTGRLQLCSAGHPPVLLRRADGTVEEPGKEIAGLPLGILPDTEYQQLDVELRPGDVIVVYSDGVTDSRSPTEELYDTKENRRLLRRVRDAAGGPEAVGQAILQEIHHFSRGHTQADDITLVSFGPIARQPY